MIIRERTFVLSPKFQTNLIINPYGYQESLFHSLLSVAAQSSCRIKFWGHFSSCVKEKNIEVKYRNLCIIKCCLLLLLL